MIAIVPPGKIEAALALGNLRRRGFAVTAILNVFDDWEYATAAGPYLAEGISTRHLKAEAAIPEICRRLLD